jgi:hypothetical protein
MHKTLKAAALALVVTSATVGIAYADSVTFNAGNVAIGYSDGYWDRGHTWHTWERAEHRDTYRAAKNAEYHEWKHDRDRDMGWHERH